MFSRKAKRRLILLVVLVFAVYALVEAQPGAIGKITGFTAKEVKETDAVEPSAKDPIVLFCPRDSCGTNLEYLINSSKKVHCAFFDLDLGNIIAALQRKEDGAALAVVDADNYKKEWLNNTNIKKDTRKAFMHNKFCVFDSNAVWTGSFNPTHNCNERNNNNAIVIFSKELAENYEAEFKELWSGNFGKGANVKNPEINIGNITIKNYFCPEDFCANHALEELSKANKSIYFMTFSFTHEKIGDLIADKYKNGVDAKGVFEKTQLSRYSQFAKLNQTGMDVRIDKNPGMMHHKVFIIDNTTVITGSFNPSINGDTSNDENMVIIYDKSIARKYLEEFEYVYK